MSKRIIALTLSIVVSFVGISGRLYYIVCDEKLVSSEHNSISITLDEKYPTLYYRDWTKATNNKPSYICIIKPTAKAISELDLVFSKEEKKDIIEELKNGYPVTRYVNQPNNSCKYIRFESIRTDENTIHQIINKSSSGLMYYINKSVGSKDITYTVDANGKLLEGDIGEIVYNNYESYEGYRLSIDEDIQNIVYNLCGNLKSGCVIVMNTSDSSILACVNKPNDTYINKALSQYAVGSVFKLIITACALENGVDLVYNCTGTINVGSLSFSCQKKHIHGGQN